MQDLSCYRPVDGGTATLHLGLVFFKGLSMRDGSRSAVQLACAAIAQGCAPEPGKAPFETIFRKLTAWQVLSPAHRRSSTANASRKEHLVEHALSLKLHLNLLLAGQHCVLLEGIDEIGPPTAGSSGGGDSSGNAKGRAVQAVLDLSEKSSPTADGASVEAGSGAAADAGDEAGTGTNEFYS